MSIIQAYSKLAAQYDSPENLNSFWGTITRQSFELFSIKENARTVVEVGCGPGLEFASLVEVSDPSVQFIAVEPAELLRNRTANRVKSFRNAKAVDGKFEELPLETNSVDYLYSILAFHWTKDLPKAVAELKRVLKPDGQMDLIFAGKESGKDFLRRVSPIYFKKLSARQVLDMAAERLRLMADEVEEAFKPEFADRQLEVTESYQTFYDTLEGHWSWWCRVDGAFSNMSAEIREECDQAAREALKSLQTEQGIPYKAHLIHVRLR